MHPETLVAQATSGTVLLEILLVLKCYITVNTIDA